MIRSLLRRHPEERITSEDILHHPWLTKENFRETVRSCSDQTVPMWEASERSSSRGDDDEDDEDSEENVSGGIRNEMDLNGDYGDARMDRDNRGFDSVRGGRTGVSFLGPSLSARFGFVGSPIGEDPIAAAAAIEQIAARRLGRL